MSKITSPHIFTSESVSEGHPDKICDRVSDSILDACLSLDAKAKVACETLVTTNFLTTAGEISCNGFDTLDPEAIARRVIKEIGYDKEEYLFCDKTFEYLNKLHGQSPDIAMGVNEGEGLDKEQGAGDQGIMFGYATNETPEYMPAPIYYSHQILKHLSDQRNSKEIPYLRPDSKSQVSIFYDKGKPVSIKSIVVSHQTDEIPLETITADIKESIKNLLNDSPLYNDDISYFINPTGKFVIGGPHGDAGVTGRKIIVDTYGGIGSHGGGAFSGKDPSKVDRSAAYYARYVAKNIVAAGLMDKCEIQVSYAIGVSEPISINVAAFGTEKIDLKKLEDILMSKEIFDFRPKGIIEQLSLLNPSGWNYAQTSNYGHFGRDIFPWERCDKVEALKNKLTV